MHYFDTPLFVYMPIIFFAYGISFFMLGVTVAIEPFAHDGATNRFKSFVSSPVGFLSFFGILHGLFEFSGMFVILYGGLPSPLTIFRLLLMSASFYFLLKFGVSYGHVAVRSKEKDHAYPCRKLMAPSYSKGVSPLNLPNVMFGIWIILSLFFLFRERFSDESFLKAEIFSRYLIGLPGAIISAFSLWAAKNDSAPGSSKYRIAAYIGFVLYAAGVSITPKAGFFPASLFNYENFYNATHIPTQAFRTFCAFLITGALLKFFRLSKDFFSIRLKATLHVIIAVMVPVLCIVLLVCYLSADALLGLSYRENEKFASLTANKVFSALDSSEESVKYHVLYSRFAEATARKDIFLSFIRENADIRGIALFDENGEILRAEKDASSPLISYRNQADDVRIRKFLGGLTIDMPVNNFYIGGHDDSNMVMIIPLSKGRIEVLLDLETLYEVGTSLSIEKGWHILIMDDKGDAVIPKGRDHFGEKEILDHHITQPGSYGKTILEKGIYYNAIESKIAFTNWSVLIEIPRSEIVAPIFNVFKALLSGVFLVYMSSLVLAVLFVQRVTKPINLIAERVKSVGKEDFAPVLNVRTGDEFQTLSEEVEKMAVLLADKKIMEKQIAQTEKIASLGRLVAGVAHEINNPLGIILGYTQLLQRECKPDSRLCEDLGKMEKHALACKKIVEDLLKFSRTNKQVNEQVDVTANIKETLSLVAKHFSAKKIDIQLDLAPDLPKILGDPNRLHQLFLNLVLNAVDAMKEGGGITVIAHSLETGTENEVEVIFRDTGCGISNENIGKIFDPFYTTKEVGKGTGLGLSVSYGIVKDHGGKIWAESVVGKGTVFHVVLPALSGDE